MRSIFISTPISVVLKSYKKQLGVNKCQSKLKFEKLREVS